MTSQPHKHMWIHITVLYITLTDKITITVTIRQEFLKKKTARPVTWPSTLPDLNPTPFKEKCRAT